VLPCTTAPLIGFAYSTMIWVRHSPNSVCWGLPDLYLRVLRVSPPPLLQLTLPVTLVWLPSLSRDNLHLIYWFFRCTTCHNPDMGDPGLGRLLRFHIRPDLSLVHVDCCNASVSPSFSPSQFIYLFIRYSLPQDLRGILIRREPCSHTRIPRTHQQYGQTP
jgi:hypothetical protein